MGNYRHLTVNISGPVARLTLDRPPLNVLNMEMLGELEGALTGIEGTEGPRVLVLDAAGKAFCAGVDVGDHMGDSAKPMLELFHRVVRKLWHYSLPSICVLEGAALGGGCEVAVSCDFVLALDSATLGQPEVAVGVLPPPAVALFPRLCGLAAAKDLIMTGRIVGAAEARDLGLVTKVVGEESLETETEKLVELLSAKSLPVLRLARKAILSSLDAPIDEALSRAESIYLGELTGLEDSEEGLRAFTERRKPQWKDR
jgi:cyclohexa-1,5-dienecarbonyl-CoA hydratase